MIVILLILLLLPFNLFAAFSVSGVDNPASVSGVATPASVSGVTSSYCTWQYVAKNVHEGNGDELNFHSSGAANKAISFVANGTYSPRRLTTRLKKNNSPTVTIEFLIRQDAGESTSRTEPGSVIISPSATLEAEDLTTSYDEYHIDITALETTELTDGNVYWFQIYGGSTSINYVKWLYGPTGDEEYDYSTAPPTTWTAGDTSVTPRLTIWSYECL